MNSKILGATIALVLGGSMQAHAMDIEEYARVINVTQQIDRVSQPRQVCDGGTPAPQDRSVGGSILGGVAGAILGNQVGGGNGRVAATAAGAIAGAVVGDRIDNRPSTPSAGGTCRMVDSWQERANGYLVTYEYNGRSYTTTMPNRPGDRIKLFVSITPSRF